MVVLIQNEDPGHLNNSNWKYWGAPIKQGANGPGPPALHNTTRKFQKNVVPVWKITNFGRQATLFNGPSMETIK